MNYLHDNKLTDGIVGETRYEMTWNYYKASNKYQNKKITIDGVKYDSKKEARRWQELKLLEKAGEIYDLRRQVKFVLIPAQREPDTKGKRGGTIKGKLLELLGQIFVQTALLI